MRSKTTMLSRRAALIGSLGAAVALGARQAFGQPAANGRVPEDEA